MARWMASKIGTPDKPSVYVAGMWRIHLASQLLWKVDPVFEEAGSVFLHNATAPDKYRAPSFSWASIDANEGYGITYAEFTDRDLLIEVEEVETTSEEQSDEYGLISAGHIYLRGKLRKAKLFKKSKDAFKGRFGWKLTNREELDAEEHTNVYLDSYRRDQNDIFGDEAGIYVLPAAKGERTALMESKYIICLLLQLLKEHDKSTYRRIGLTKLSPWADSGTVHKILDVYPSDVDMPHQGYDAKTGMHRILII